MKKNISEGDILLAMIIIIVALWTLGKDIPYFIKTAITTTIMFVFMTIALVVGPKEE